MLYAGCCVGICIPNVEFVLGLVGSTLGTAVCSVGPAWIYLQVAPPSSSERFVAKVSTSYSVVFVRVVDNLLNINFIVFSISPSCSTHLHFIQLRGLI